MSAAMEEAALRCGRKPQEFLRQTVRGLVAPVGDNGWVWLCPECGRRGLVTHKNASRGWYNLTCHVATQHPTLFGDLPPVPPVRVPEEPLALDAPSPVRVGTPVPNEPPAGYDWAHLPSPASSTSLVHRSERLDRIEAKLDRLLDIWAEDDIHIDLGMLQTYERYYFEAALDVLKYVVFDAHRGNRRIQLHVGEKRVLLAPEFRVEDSEAFRAAVRGIIHVEFKVLTSVA